jgi:curved DNA-binding protein
MKYIDYYETLGVPRSATGKEIKQAYRKLARQHHPDLHQGDAKHAAEEKFKLINEAYEVLGDTEKRKKYDQLGRNWQAGQDFEPPGANGYSYHTVNMDDFGFSDFFASVFGQDNPRQGGRRQTSYQGEDVNAEIQLSVEEIIHGAEKELQLSMPNVCAACQGQRFTRQGVCRACGGMGIADETKTVKVKIPATLYPGAALRLKGLGGKGAGGAPDGDLYLHISVAPHPLWQVINTFDLEADLSIYPEQAVLGGKIPVPTSHGKVQVTLQPGLRAGQKLRLKGKGLRREHGGYGDLYLKVKVDIPPNQSSAEIELYRQIQALRLQ